MKMAENKNKMLYKLEILFLKFIPYLLAICNFVHTILFVLGIQVPILIYISGISIIPMLFLYVSSYVFKFCEYHRIPLHYVVFNNIINILDGYFVFNISDYNFIIIHSLLFGLFSILCGIFKILDR